MRRVFLAILDYQYRARKRLSSTKQKINVRGHIKEKDTGWREIFCPDRCPLRAPDDEYCSGCPRDFAKALASSTKKFGIPNPHRYWDIAHWAMCGAEEEDAETALELLAVEQLAQARQLFEADITWKPPQ